MNETKISLDSTFKTAINFLSNGNITEARNIFEKILKVKPDHILSLANLGIIFIQLKKYDEAMKLFKRTIEINPEYAEGHNNIGNILFELLEFDEALNYYNKAIEISPNFSDAFNNLGNIYFKKENFDKAIESYESAIFNNNTGLNKDKPYFNLGNIFRELENFEKSIDFYKKAIDLNPNSIDAYINLSISLNKNGNLEEAISCCKTALKKDSKNIKAINNLGRYSQEIGREDLAITYYNKAIELDPTNLRSRWQLMNTFPIIYKNSDQVNSFKKHFEKNLNIVENFLDKNNSLNNEKILSALNSSTNFYLHYLSDDITNLQKRYSSIIRKLTKNLYPEFHKKVEFNKSSKFIRVGFISSFFRDHVISKLFKNWIIKLNKNKFKTFVYHVSKKNDHITDLIKENCHSFLNETNISKITKRITEDKLDVLIYLDIGMVPKMQILGSLQLATIQCCAYGVPVTSGFKNIDYFLSGEKMETDLSQEFYVEKLIKLPGLGVDYDPPKKIKVNNINYKKEKNKVIFLNLQSNFKLLPQNDYVYFEILKKNPNCEFWFIETKNKFISKKFKDRISIICQKNNLCLEDFFVFHPETAYQKYLDLINKADIILDSFDWSGLNTSLDAICLNKPLITFPSNFMRGRHSYGILKILKIDELICSSKKEYIDLAVKLSKNFDFRESVLKKIKENKKLIFNNYKAINSLENFFLSLFEENSLKH